MPVLRLGNPAFPKLLEAFKTPRRVSLLKK